MQRSELAGPLGWYKVTYVIKLCFAVTTSAILETIQEHFQTVVCRFGCFGGWFSILVRIITWIPALLIGFTQMRQQSFKQFKAVCRHVTSCWVEHFTWSCLYCSLRDVGQKDTPSDCFETKNLKFWLNVHMHVLIKRWWYKIHLYLTVLRIEINTTNLSKQWQNCWSAEINQIHVIIFNEWSNDQFLPHQR